LVFRATVLVLNHHAITATTLHALITFITVSALYTENQSMFLTIALVSGHPTATAITIHVHITITKVDATDTVRSSVVTALAEGLEQVLTATTINDAVSLTCYRLNVVSTKGGCGRLAEVVLSDHSLVLHCVQVTSVWLLL